MAQKHGSGILSSQSEHLNRRTRKGMGDASHRWLGALCSQQIDIIKTVQVCLKKKTFLKK